MFDAVVFDVQRLSKVHRMGEVEVHALHESHFTVLLGPSGSGKSTLLNILGGLDVATTGRVLYPGGYGEETSNIAAIQEAKFGFRNSPAVTRSACRGRRHYSWRRRRIESRSRSFKRLPEEQHGAQSGHGLEKEKPQP